jgi:hypothetical protein
MLNSVICYYSHCPVWKCLPHSFFFFFLQEEKSLPEAAHLAIDNEESQAAKTHCLEAGKRFQKAEEGMLRQICSLFCVSKIYLNKEVVTFLPYSKPINLLFGEL